MVKLDKDSLLKHLDEKQLKPQWQEESNQIIMAFRLGKIDFPIFLRIAEDEDFLQILSFMPCSIKHGTHAALARFLHVINNQVNLPGFSMDDEQNLLFYRVILPCVNREVDEKMLEKYLGAVFNVSNSFYPLIVKLADGSLTYKDALTELRTLKPAQETPVQESK
jgi:hypothetical protein